MNHEEVEKIILEQGRAAAARQAQLRRLLVGAFIYITVLSTVFGIIIWSQNNTIRSQDQSVTELSEILNRRSPILEYLKCHDEAEDDRNKAQFAYIEAVIASEGNFNDPEVLRIQKEYYDAEIKLAAATRDTASICPNFPTIPESGD